MKEVNYGNNRAARRWHERNSGVGEHNAYVTRHERIHERLRDTVGLYNSLYTGNTTVAEAVYQKGVPAEETVDAMIDHSRGIDDGWRLIQGGKASTGLGEYLQYCNDNDPIVQTHKGVSISSIADMSSPLSGEDIRKISDLFYVGLFRRPNEVQKHNTALLSNFTVQSQLPGPHARITPRTQRLKENMTSYFDYWAEVFTNSANLAEGGYLHMDFLRMMLSQHLLYTTIAYIPARLGVSPSSAMELFEEFAEMSNFTARRTLKKGIRTNTAQTLRQSYIPSKVPEDILPFILPDSQNSESVSSFLEKEIAIPEGENEQFEVYNARNRAIKQLNTQVLPGVLRSLAKGKEVVNLVPQESDYITKIQIAQQYSKATIIVLHLKNGSRLTLDFTKNNRVYGFPHRVRQQNPSIEDQVILDAVDSITVELRRQREHAYQAQKQNTENHIVEFGKPAYQVHPPQEHRPKKIKTRGEQGEQQEEPITEIADEPAQQARINFVAYDESLIKKELGGKASAKTVRQVSNALYRFGYGEKSAKLLEFDPSHNTIRLRAGNFRIVLRRIDESQFEIIKIGDRKNVYSKVTA